jgi:hypothetical protein
VPYLNHVHRTETNVVLIHRVTGLPEDTGPRHVDNVFRRLGMLSSSPFTFIMTADAQVHDCRDVRSRTAYHLDSIDIGVLCVGAEPSDVQQQSLNDLVSALLLDYPSDAQPQVVTVQI